MHIDDIIFFWEHGKDTLKVIVDNINNMHPTIKFTADWSRTSIHFLDVSITEGIIEIDLYIKPTESHQCILLSSYLFYCKKGIPYSQALGFNRICSNNEVFFKKNAMF